MRRPRADRRRARAGKTLAVKTLALVGTLEFRRVQCTPDLMPADILGHNNFQREGQRTFSLHQWADFH